MTSQFFWSDLSSRPSSSLRAKAECYLTTSVAGSQTSLPTGSHPQVLQVTISRPIGGLVIEWGFHSSAKLLSAYFRVPVDKAEGWKNLDLVDLFSQVRTVNWKKAFENFENIIQKINFQSMNKPKITFDDPM